MIRRRRARCILPPPPPPLTMTTTHPRDECPACEHVAALVEENAVAYSGIAASFSGVLSMSTNGHHATATFSSTGP